MSAAFSFRVQGRAPETFIKSLAGLFDATIVENRFTIPTHRGKGSVRLIQLDSGLSINIINASIGSPLTVYSKAKSFGSYYPLILTLSEAAINVRTGNMFTSMGLETRRNIFLPSPQSDFTFYIPSETRIKILAVYLSHEWIQANVDHLSLSGKFPDLPKAGEFLDGEQVGPSAFELALQVMKIAEDTEPFNHVAIKGISMQFIAGLLNALHRHHSDVHKPLLSAKDIELATMLKERITTAPLTKGELNLLYHEFGLDVNRIQKLFKRVHGTTIYQYNLKTKMDRAKQLLESGEYTVSEVGYSLGYSNLSHFSRIFKRQFGLSPKYYGKSE